MQHCHPSPMVHASVTSLLAWLTLCFPFRQKLHRALSARADHRVSARTLVCRLIWQQREEARKSLRASPNNDHLHKAVKKAGKNLEKLRKTAVLSFLWAHVRKLEERVRKGDQAGF